MIIRNLYHLGMIGNKVSRNSLLEIKNGNSGKKRKSNCTTLQLLSHRIGTMISIKSISSKANGQKGFANNSSMQSKFWGICISDNTLFLLPLKDDRNEANQLFITWPTVQTSVSIYTNQNHPINLLNQLKLYNQDLPSEIQEVQA